MVKSRLISFAFFIAFTAMILVSEMAKASNIISFQWPPNNKGNITYTNNSGLNLLGYSNWTGNRGYRQIEITISSSKPVLGDTQITLKLLAGEGWQQHASITAEKDLEIPQGSNSATTTLFIPQYHDWSVLSFEVWVDGIKDQELSPDVRTLLSSGATSMAGNRKTGPLGYFFTRNDKNRYFEAFSNSEIFDAIALQSTSLPTDWKQYSAVDFVFVYPEDLERWKKLAPQKFTHLLRWIRAGGNLWIVENGPNFENIDSVENILQLNNPGQDKNSSLQEQNNGIRGWYYLPLSESQTAGSESIVILEGLVKKNPEEDDETPKDQDGKPIIKNSQDYFVARSYGMGTIVAFPSTQDNSRIKLREAVSAIYNSTLSSRIHWGERHGNDPSNGNFEFGRHLIPDVGTAPVIEFQLLISLFIVCIGPVNYWLLRKKHRLPMMLLTVPVAALFTTLLLFTYGFLVDGLNVKVQARSLTVLDQRLGESACWSHLSYYAGMAPSQGLSLPEDNLIYPILPSKSGNRRSRSEIARQERNIEWNDGQKLVRGWLASRTPTQYLTISSQATKKKIAFDLLENGMQVTNQLGTEIVALFARDKDGNFYLDSNIAPDQTSQPNLSESIPTTLELRKIVSDNEPEFPAGLEAAQLANMRGSRRRNNRYQSSLVQSQGLLEDYLKSFISPTSIVLAPGSYLAITATGLDVDLGLEEVTESSSFHVVKGTW